LTHSSVISLFFTVSSFSRFISPDNCSLVGISQALAFSHLSICTPFSIPAPQAPHSSSVSGVTFSHSARTNGIIVVAHSIAAVAVFPAHSQDAACFPQVAGHRDNANDRPAPNLFPALSSSLHPIYFSSTSQACRFPSSSSHLESGFSYRPPADATVDRTHPAIFGHS
jgi:hypothetical protein